MTRSLEHGAALPPSCRQSRSRTDPSLRDRGVPFSFHLKSPPLLTA